MKSYWIQEQFKDQTEEATYFKYISRTKKNEEQFKEFMEFKNWGG